MLSLKSEDKQRLMRKSVDVRCEEFNIKLKACVYLSLLLFVTALAVVVFREYPQEMKKGIIYYYVLFSVSYIPLILFSVFNRRSMVKNAEEYLFIEASLSEFGVSMGRYYFTVSFYGDKGQRYTEKTNALYREYSKLARFEDWRNAKVIVAYSRLHGKIYVVCRADELSAILG